MDSMFYPDKVVLTEEVNTKVIDKLINKLQFNTIIGVLDDEKDITQRALMAGELSRAYPHLDTEVVVVSTLLFPLLKKGYLIGLEGAMAVLDGVDIEKRFKVMRVLVQAQTDVAGGEAKIVQYFCH